MNWLQFGFFLLGIYIIWFTYILLKKKFSKHLLWYGLAHFPYLLLNLVAPFRGIMDPDYAGYSVGLIDLPKGILVPVVVGMIVLGSFFLITKSFLSDMEKWWKLGFVYDLALTITIAAPILIGIILDPSAASIQLGEFLTISGYVVAIIVLVIISGPTFWACYFSGKRALKASASSKSTDFSSQ